MFLLSENERRLQFYELFWPQKYADYAILTLAFLEASNQVPKKNMPADPASASLSAAPALAPPQSSPTPPPSGFGPFTPLPLFCRLQRPFPDIRCSQQVGGGSVSAVTAATAAPSIFLRGLSTVAAPRFFSAAAPTAPPRHCASAPVRHRARPFPTPLPHPPPYQISAISRRRWVAALWACADDLAALYPLLLPLSVSRS